MKNSLTAHSLRLSIIACVALVAFVTLPFLLIARSRTTSINVSIVNQSGWEIRHVYLQAGDQDTWGEDQLGGSVIASGGSYTLSNLTCDGQSLKVITEDKEGCFLNTTVSCGGNATWTISNDLHPDCGN